MEIIGFCLFIFIAFFAALYFNFSEKEKLYYPSYELENIAAQDRCNSQSISNGNLEDEILIIDSVLDYMDNIGLNEMQKSVRTMLQQDKDYILKCINKNTMDKFKLNESFKFNDDLAMRYRGAAEHSFTCMEPFVFGFGFIGIGIIFCLLGCIGIGLTMIIILGPIVSTICFIVSAVMSQHNINVRHELGIYNKSMDMKDHINSGICTGYAIHSIHSGYKRSKEVGEYFQHKHDF